MTQVSVITLCPPYFLGELLCFVSCWILYLRFSLSVALVKVSLGPICSNKCVLEHFISVLSAALIWSSHSFCWREVCILWRSLCDFALSLLQAIDCDISPRPSGSRRWCHWQLFLGFSSHLLCCFCHQLLLFSLANCPCCLLLNKTGLSFYSKTSEIVFPPSFCATILIEFTFFASNLIVFLQ